MCQLVTADIFELATQHSNVSSIYTEDEVEDMTKEDTMMTMREDSFLEEVYGAASRLDKDQWLAKVSKVTKWLLDARDLRKKVLDTASVNPRH